MSSLHPNLILYNGAIHTFDPAKPQVSAIACYDGKIIATGDDAAITALAGPSTRTIDLQGATAVPGFNDAHNHMLEVGIKYTRVRLDECQSIEEMVELVHARAC
jgi:predicted amidohydrolase YtcJ